MTELKRETLGSEVQRARQRMGLSQDELGQQTGLGQTVVSRIESGARKIDLVELVRIATVLHTSVDEILNNAMAAEAAETLPIGGDELELLALRLQGQDTPEQVRQALDWVPDFVASLRSLEQTEGKPARD
jgi:transcriptional regulator with XRE-family HTH domain